MRCSANSHQKTTCTNIAPHDLHKTESPWWRNGLARDSQAASQFQQFCEASNPGFYMAARALIGCLRDVATLDPQSEEESMVQKLRVRHSVV